MNFNEYQNTTEFAADYKNEYKNVIKRMVSTSSAYVFPVYSPNKDNVIRRIDADEMYLRFVEMDFLYHEKIEYLLSVNDQFQLSLDNADCCFQLDLMVKKAHPMIDMGRALDVNLNRVDEMIDIVVGYRGFDHEGHLLVKMFSEPIGLPYVLSLDHGVVILYDRPLSLLKNCIAYYPVNRVYAFISPDGFVEIETRKMTLFAGDSPISKMIQAWRDENDLSDICSLIDFLRESVCFDDSFLEIITPLTGNLLITVLYKVIESFITVDVNGARLNVEWSRHSGNHGCSIRDVFMIYMDLCYGNDITYLPTDNEQLIRIGASMESTRFPACLSSILTSKGSSMWLYDLLELCDEFDPDALFINYDGPITNALNGYLIMMDSIKLRTRTTAISIASHLTNVYYKPSLTYESADEFFNSLIISCQLPKISITIDNSDDSDSGSSDSDSDL
jgi:hypothetical protein